MNKENNKIRLLLVDDEDEFRQAASQALSRQGFNVTETSNGKQAVEIVYSSPPEVVVLDLKMEGMDGIATLKEFRKKAPNLPVVILTGHGRLEDAVAGIRLDIVDFVQKPVDMKDLADRIRRLLMKGKDGQLREKTVAELMVPVQAYRKFYMDQTVQEIVAALTEVVFRPVCADEVTQRGRRAVLVFDRKESFVGLLRVEDIVKHMVPLFLRDSPYSSYFTGMFLAQTKVIGKQNAGRIISSYFSIKIDTPLMEAVSIMAAERLTNLPIMSDRVLVGILRDEDIFKEISDSILGR